MEKTFFGRLPGYAVVRSLTQRLAGESDESAWQPVLAEIEDALVPAFIIEEFDDGRYTVFVPSVPTPFAGAVYILNRERVHLVDIPFTDAMKSISMGIGVEKHGGSNEQEALVTASKVNLEQKRWEMHVLATN
jgi:uncharacterized membrane protein